MKKPWAKCFILHSRPFKESSLIFNLFSQNDGRFSVIAKGVKRKNAQAIRAILQAFNFLNIEYTGQSELKVLCQVELLQQWSKSSNRVLACGYYLNELVIRATQEAQELDQLFVIYQFSLKQLQNCESDNPFLLAVILRQFEVLLLAELGVAPDWEFDIKGNPIQVNSHYRLIDEHGFEILDKASDNSTVFKAGLTGESILALAKGCYTADNIKQCRSITQKLLLPVIGNQPFASRKMWL